MDRVCGHDSSPPFALRLIEIQFARALRLTFARVLAALEVRAAWSVDRHLSAACVSTAAEWTTGLRLELLGEFAFGAATASAVWIAPLRTRLLELVASVFSIVSHEISLMSLDLR